MFGSIQVLKPCCVVDRWLFCLACFCEVCRLRGLTSLCLLGWVGREGLSEFNLMVGPFYPWGFFVFLNVRVEVG